MKRGIFALQDSSAGFLFENIPIGAVIVAKDNRIIQSNKQICEIFGSTEEELISHQLQEHVHLEDRNNLLNYYARMFRGEQFNNLFSTYLVTKDGETKWITFNSLSINWEGKSAILSFVTDITELKHAQTELGLIEHDIVQSQKMKSLRTLAGGIAHDFNNLLLAIIGNIDRAMIKMKKNDLAYDQLEQAKSATFHAGGIIRQLLIFSQNQPMESRIINLNSVVDSVVKIISGVITSNIKTKVFIDPELENINGDARSIEQVIINLIINAQDALPDGGTIIIKTQNIMLNEQQCRSIPKSKPGSYVLLSVEDTGSGIAEEILPHIFDPFFSTKPLSMSTGLGLSIAYGVAKQHEGWINVTSQPGKGSLFDVYFPACLQEPEVEKEAEEFILESYKGAGQRILVVEDELHVRQFITDLLSENGYEVIECISIREAVQQFERLKGKIELLFCDVVLPDGNAFELADIIRARKPDCAILLSSGYVDEKAQYNKIKEGGFLFLQKPYNAEELLKFIKKAIEK